MENCKKPVGLFFFDSTQTYTNAVNDHIKIFERSNYRISFIDYRRLYTGFNFLGYSFIVIHYSVRLPFEALTGIAAIQLHEQKIPKILFIQDEYNGLDKTLFWINYIGFDLIYTTFPIELAMHCYRMPAKRFVNNLTGYIPSSLSDIEPLPFSKRPIDLGYRGRRLPLIYGHLGRLKHEFADHIKKNAQNYAPRMVLDIETDDKKRIYGDYWVEFIGNCKAMYVPDSGSNIIDFSSALDYSATAISKLYSVSSRNFYPKEIVRNQLAQYEINGLTNQISPKLFEIVAYEVMIVAHPNSVLSSYGLEKQVDYWEIENNKTGIKNLERFLKSSLAPEIAKNAKKKIFCGPFQESYLLNSFDKKLLELMKNQLCLTKEPIAVKPYSRPFFSNSPQSPILYYLHYIISHFAVFIPSFVKKNKLLRRFLGLQPRLDV